MSWRNVLCFLCAAMLCSGAVLADNPTGAVQAGSSSTEAVAQFPNAGDATKAGFTGNEPPAWEHVPEPGMITQQGDTCANPFTITVGQTVNGTTAGFANDYDYACPYTGSTSPDVVYRLVLTAPAVLDVTACVASYDNKLYIYGTSCVNPPIACNDDICGSDGWKAALYGVSLAAGTYHIIMDGYGGESGTFTLIVAAATPCVVTCPTGGIPENEPMCGPNYVDATNGGCNSTPAVFGSVSCGQTICGRYGTFLYGTSNYRDTDWFRIPSVPASRRVTVAGRGEGSTLFFILRIVPPCTASVLGSISGAACTDLTVSFDNMTAATDLCIWAGPSVFTGVPCDADYFFTLTCTEIAPCSVPCQSGDVLENEAPCANDVEDTFNSGCNFTAGAPPFSPYTCGTWVCGMMGNFLFGGNQYRDTDWYTFTLGGTSNWDLAGTGRGEAPFLMFIIRSGPDPMDPCTGYAILVNASAAQCVDITGLNASGVAPGTYWMWCGTSVFAGWPCTSRYRARIVCTTLAPCVVTCPSGGVPENEPLCGPNYVDATNGGCNSTPAVFGTTICGRTICGKSGTYLYGTYNYRDTDWFQFTTTIAGDITNTMNAEFGALTFVLSITPPCSANVLASATAAQCVDAIATALNQPAGTYVAWAGPSVFTGVPCDADYNLRTVCAAPCVVTCPTGGVLEGEPLCGPDYVDNYNGGCNSTPYVFRNIACNTWLCGKSGTYLYGTSNYRDTDWFKFTTTAAGNIVSTMNGEFSVLTFVLTIGTPDCATITVLANATAAPCADAVATATAQPAGNYVVWAGPSVFTGVPCDADYNLRVTATCAVPCTRRGDANCNGVINAFDIDCFVAAVAGGQSAWLTCIGAGTPCTGADYLCVNDVNCDGAVNAFDIDRFVWVIVNVTTPPAPCP